MGIAWGYAVVSSSEQEATLPEQVRWMREESARLGIELGRVFEGTATGKFGARRILRDLIDALHSTPKVERPTVVLMTRLDRTGRELLDSVSALNEIRKLGVTIRTRVEGEVKLSRVAEQIGPVFALVQAAYESEVRSDRAKAGHARRRAAGLHAGTKIPYGSQRDKDGHLVPDPERAPSVVQAAELYTQCHNWTQVAAFLELAPGRIQRSRRSGELSGELKTRWYAATARRLLTNPALRGSIVPEPLWDQVQAARTSRPFLRHRYRIHVYPLSGILCPCGRPLWGSPGIGYSKSKNGKRYPLKHHYHYYVCRAPSHGKQVSWRDDVVEAAWIRFMGRLEIDAGKLVEHLTSSDKYVIEARKRRLPIIDRRLEKLASRLRRAHEGYEDGTYDGATLRTRVAEIEREAGELRTQRSALVEEAGLVDARMLEREEVGEILASCSEIWEAADQEQRRSLFRLFQRSIGPLRLVVGDGVDIAAGG